MQHGINAVVQIEDVDVRKRMRRINQLHPARANVTSSYRFVFQAVHSAGNTWNPRLHIEEVRLQNLMDFGVHAVRFLHKVRMSLKHM